MRRMWKVRKVTLDLEIGITLFAQMSPSLPSLKGGMSFGSEKRH